MGWSGTTPSTAGFYWYRARPGDRPRVVVVGPGPAAHPAGEWLGPLDLPAGKGYVVALPPLPPEEMKAVTRPG